MSPIIAGTSPLELVAGVIGMATGAVLLALMLWILDRWG
jgi:hypothetical protein